MRRTVYRIRTPDGTIIKKAWPSLRALSSHLGSGQGPHGSRKLTRYPKGSEILTVVILETVEDIQDLNDYHRALIDRRRGHRERRERREVQEKIRRLQETLR